MEPFLWLFVAVTLIMLAEFKEAVTMNWYLIYRYDHLDGINGLKSRKPVDGVHAQSSHGAIKIAKKRNDHFSYEYFRAECCYSVADRLRASELNDVHATTIEPWWSRQEFVEYMQTVETYTKERAW